MRIFGLIAIVLIVFTSCETNKVFNRTVEPSNGRELLIGAINVEGLSAEPYGAWFNKSYETYTPNIEKIDSLSKKLRRYKIEVFMGTWCGDSRREVPRLLKILDQAKFPKTRLTMYAVDTQKKSFYGEELNKNIKRVPTIIFYTEGDEANRIIEYPVNESLEEDILRIVSEKAYTPNYANLK